MLERDLGAAFEKVDQKTRLRNRDKLDPGIEIKRWKQPIRKMVHSQTIINDCERNNMNKSRYNRFR